MRAKRAALEIVPAASLDQTLRKQTIHKAEYPKKSRAGEVLEGTPSQKAEQLLNLLFEKSLLQ